MSIFSRAKSDMSFIKIDPKKLSEKGKRKRRRGISTVVGIVMSLIMAACCVVGAYSVIKMNVLPLKYVIAGVGILFGLWLVAFLTQYAKFKLPGKIIAVLISLVMVYVTLFSSKFLSALTITSTQMRTDVVDVIVKKSDPAEDINYALNNNYTFAYNSSNSDALCLEAANKINKENSTSIIPSQYNDWDEVFADLEANTKVQAVLVDDSIYQSLIKETYSSSYNDTKIIGQIKIDVSVNTGSTIDVSKESFVVYLSGNDESGEIKTTGRSDVNLLLVANPKTKQILLVTTPRDSYIMIEDDKGNTGLDKLTHAGLAGIDNSEEALKDLYSTKIDFFMKVNFTGIVKLVDALGGIEVNSDVAFTNGYDAAPVRYRFNEGMNSLDGAKALAFCRERQAFSNGDFQRGQNEMAVMEGILNKLTSPAILANYSPVLDAFSSMVYTDMPVNSITSLLRMQLSGGEGWNIQSCSISGDVGTRNGRVYGLKNMSVILPYKLDVEKTSEMIRKTLAGEVFNVEEFTEGYVSPDGTKERELYEEDFTYTSTSKRTTQTTETSKRR